VSPTPRVSVLMGMFNAAHHLDSAIESIVSQSYTNWELILVDDGSTDSSLAVAQTWCERDGRIRTLTHQVNCGLAVSLNHGFALSKGELVARMDADDASLPVRLERQVAFLEGRPDVAVVGTGAQFVDAEGNFLGTGHLLEEHEDIAANIYRTTPFIHPSVMMRRGFLESLGGYDVRLRRAQDADLWLRGYRRFRYHNLSEPLIRCRIRKRGGVDTRSMLTGTFVLARSAVRERRPVSGGMYAGRFLVSTALVKAGVRQRRLPQQRLARRPPRLRSS
jgi:glycosyltransferase involved in cell wall biosynthesis